MPEKADVLKNWKEKELSDPMKMERLLFELMEAGNKNIFPLSAWTNPNLNVKRDRYCALHIDIETDTQ